MLIIELRSTGTRFGTYFIRNHQAYLTSIHIYFGTWYIDGKATTAELISLSLSLPPYVVFAMCACSLATSMFLYYLFVASGRA
jgi:hypothetical protein